MKPLERCFEAAPGGGLELPEALRRLYGGDLGLPGRLVYANFVSTLDGVVAIPSLPRSNAAIAAGSEADRFVMGLLRAAADVVLIGAGTLRGSPQGSWTPERAYPAAREAFAELRRRLGLAETPEVAILSGSGSVDPRHPVLASGALILTSRAGAARLRGRTPPQAAVEVLAEEEGIEPRRVVEALERRGHRRILVEAGPRGFASLVASGCVDELFLTLSPLLAGRGGGDRLGLVEGAALLPPGAPARLLGLRRHGGHVFLRYAIGGHPGTVPLR
jgi:riboflavin biosynthesis pyrimidine reductase